MQLVRFRIQNFRSINDSGEIDVSQRTAFVGRNESGKSNLLLALQSLNPPGGIKPLNPIKDFPRHRKLSECDDWTRVVSTSWTLDAETTRELEAIFPRASSVTEVHIHRNYSERRLIGWTGLGGLPYNAVEIKASVKKIVAAVKAAAAKLSDEDAKEALTTSLGAFERDIAAHKDGQEWAKKAVTALDDIRTALASADAGITDRQEEVVAELEALAEELVNDDDLQAKARALIMKRLPVFMYLDDYPELDGHQNINEYLSRVGHHNETIADRNFGKLCKVAGLDANQLHSLKDSDPETRNQLANRASSVVTKEIRRLWKDRALKVRFNPDGNYLDTFISDPNAVFDVEVNLDERSRGFKWFFSFYISFSADTAGGSAENAILLLDEPGLYLHAKSQADLLKHFEADFKNQILYTTHSPFMVPTHALNTVRTVNVEETAGTTVTNDPTGDYRTLFPIQAALGYDLAQSLFVGANNLVVEGVTDYWILSSVTEYFRAIGKVALDTRLTITPAGGAQKVSYMVTLLSSQQLNVLVLLDAERDAIATREFLVKGRLIDDRNVVLTSEAFAGAPDTDADIEDLIDSSVYESLVKECYAKELKGTKLKINQNIPRIAKRYGEAFSAAGLDFNKTRVARKFLAEMGSHPEKVVTPEMTKRFERLFESINERLEKHLSRNAAPFR